MWFFLFRMLWGAIYETLYLHYDTSQEFMPQFQAVAKLSHCQTILLCDTLFTDDGLIA